MSNGRKATVALMIVSRLAEVPRATCRKLADDIGCHESSVSKKIKELMKMKLVESCGIASIPGVKCGPIIYKLHFRLKENA